MFEIANNEKLDTARKAFIMRFTIKCMQESFNAIENCKVPVIGVAKGYCIGAGVEIFACCDIVYCDNSVKFALKEIKIGMGADLGGFQRLSLSVKNIGLLKELSYTGRFFNAQEAL